MPRWPIGARKATCHPDRKHYARGFCLNCYKKYKPESQVKATCHPDRPHHGLGLCQACLGKQYWLRSKNDPKKREKRRKHTRRATLRVYGLTPEDYDRMYREQDGLCAICHRPPKEGRPLYVDHNHQTNVVRQLLCMDCNNGLEDFDENVEFLKAAIAYLERHNRQLASKEPVVESSVQKKVN